VLATFLAESKPEASGIVVAVTFLDASGISGFIQARSRRREHGRDLLLWVLRHL
jgi:hypothetical protein